MKYVHSLYFRVIAGLACALSFTVGVARADVSDVFLRIEASNALGSDTYEVMTTDATFIPGPNLWVWSGVGINLETPGGDPIASVNTVNQSVVADPQIILGFSLQNANLATTVTITSALLSFPVINNGVGHASASMTLTDNSGGGAALMDGITGPSADRAFRADYNGGTNFAELIDQILVNDSFGNGSITENHGDVNNPIPMGVVNSMQSSVSFTLTAGDSTSGNFVYVVTPEPAALSLLAVGGLALLRRRG